MENKAERFNQMNHLLSVSRKQRWMGLLLHDWPFDRGTSALSWSFHRLGRCRTNVHGLCGICHSKWGACGCS